jgi:hypothetical protein
MRGGGIVATEEILEGASGWRDTGGETALSIHEALYASVLAGRGRIDDALTLIQAARDRMEASAERVHDAVILRLQAEMALVRCGDGLKHAAHQTPTRAIAVAHRQGAHLFELRASVTLARVWMVHVWMVHVWMAEGRDANVHQWLASAPASFKGDFDTVDLIEARALLSATA